MKRSAEAIAPSLADEFSEALEAGNVKQIAEIASVVKRGHRIFSPATKLVFCNGIGISKPDLSSLTQLYWENRKRMRELGIDLDKLKPTPFVRPDNKVVRRLQCKAKNGVEDIVEYDGIIFASFDGLKWTYTTRNRKITKEYLEFLRRERNRLNDVQWFAFCKMERLIPSHIAGMLKCKRKL